MSSKPATETQSPPVSAYSTLQNFLLSYKQIGPPTRIEPTAIKHMGGTVKAQLFQTLRFFRLINEQNQTQDDLNHLVSIEGEERAQFLRSIIERSYPFIFNAKGFDLTRASDKELLERFESVGLTGDLQRKAKAFFLNACEDAEITVSNHINPPKKRSPTKAPKANGTPSTKRPRQERVQHQPPAGDKKVDDSLPKPFVEAMQDLMSISSSAKQWTVEERELFWKMAEHLLKSS